jgi:hypothetical protein
MTELTFASLLEMAQRMRRLTERAPTVICHPDRAEEIRARLSQEWGLLAPIVRPREFVPPGTVYLVHPDPSVSARTTCTSCWFGECGGSLGDRLPAAAGCPCCAASHHGRRYCPECGAWHAPDEEHDEG